MKLFRSASRRSGLVALLRRPTTLSKGGASKGGPSGIGRVYRLAVLWSITDHFLYRRRAECGTNELHAPGTRVWFGHVAAGSFVFASAGYRIHLLSCRLASICWTK